MDNNEKFKVWDKVKVVRGKHGIPIGTTGFISEIYRSYPFEERVKITYRFISEFDNDYQGQFNGEDLELYENDAIKVDFKSKKGIKIDPLTMKFLELLSDMIECNRKMEQKIIKIINKDLEKDILGENND